MPRSPALGVLTACALSHAAYAAALVNGGFDSGSLPPWVVSPTPFGDSIGTGVALFDMDGPGPLPPSNAARFIVGQTVMNTGLQGVTLAQTVSLQAGERYELRARLAVWALVNVYSQSGGTFDLVVDGQPLATFVAPTTFAGQRVYSALGAAFTATRDGPHDIGVRIRRSVIRGEEVLQFIDDARLRPARPGDVNEDGVVNFADLNLVLSQFGQTGAPGQLPADADFDGHVGFPDLNLVLSNFGQTR